MKAKRISKRLLKITGFILAGILLLLTIFHIWFIHHSKDLLESMVNDRSNGRLKLKIESLRYNYFNRRMLIKNASFFTVDSTSPNTSHYIDVREIRITLRGIIPFLTEKRLLIEYLNLNAPDIKVTRLRNNLPVTKPRADPPDVSVPYEMGQVYRSIQNVLRELHVQKFWIHNGKFTIINNIDPGQLPVRITDINLNIENLKVREDTLTGKEGILFSDNIMLHCNNQDILFPDGRHRLKFESFKIDLRGRIVEFKNCTISGEKKDSSNAAFSIFFNNLRLSNVDFDTLYRESVIKADTVFCLNPRFKLLTEINKGTTNINPGPRLENIIKQLTGDLLLAKVIVKNASFDISTIKNGVPNSFTSEKNDFEMKGLSINQEAKKPVTVKGFVMAIRNYENFIKDSSYRVLFDSVLFREDKIYLSNFIFQKLNNGRIVNAFNIPQFYLGGLSWDDLVFNKKLSAEQATLFNPKITYYVSDKTKKKPQKNIFNAIAAIDDYMDLEYLDIQNGDIKLVYDSTLNIQLKDASLAIESRSLLHSTDIAGIKKSLNNLKFKDGTIHAGGLKIHLKNTYYIGEQGRFKADRILVNSDHNKFTLDAEGIEIEKMLVNEKNGDIAIDGMTWQKGNLVISMNGNQNRDLKSVLELKKISGRNTSLNLAYGPSNFTASIENISFDKLEKKPGSLVKIENLKTSGNNLGMNNKTNSLKTGSFSITDQKQSFFKNLLFTSSTTDRNVKIISPQVTLLPQINSLLEGKINLEKLELDQPEITIIIKSNSGPAPIHTEAYIKTLTLNNPSLHYISSIHNDSTSLVWNSRPGAADFITAKNFAISKERGYEITISNINFLAGNYKLSGLKNLSLSTDHSVLQGAIRDLNLSNPGKSPNHTDGFIENLSVKDISIDNIGNKQGKLKLDRFQLHNFNLGSLKGKSISEIVVSNPKLLVTGLYGNYTDTVKIIDWKNVHLDRDTKLLSAERLEYHPVKSQKEFMAEKKFQTDYISFETGKIQLKGFDLPLYLKNDLLSITSAHIDNVNFQSFRDKRLPFKSGIIKFLPAALPEKSATELLIDSITFSNSKALYAELDSKTLQTAYVPLADLNATFYNVKSKSYTPEDSFRVAAHFNLLDSIPTTLDFRQSYSDSLHGFLLSAQMKKTDIKIINPVMGPLASVSIKSGKLDSLNMNVTGNEYLATGELMMAYRDLKIELLSANPRKKNKFRNFLLNAFIIKDKNRNKKSAIFFERLRDKSVFQYIVRIFISGISTSTGLKNNKKTYRRIQKGQKY